MSDDTYHGWANRETWALNLWFTSDQGLYELALENARNGAQSYEPGEFGPPTVPDYYIGEGIAELWRELTDPSQGLLPTETIITMLRDVGSEHRVNWDESGAYWLSDLEGDPE